MLTSGNSVQDPMDIFQQCKFSHSPTLLSLHNLCGVPLQVFVQMHNALNLKLKNNLAHYRAVAARRRQCAAGSCVGKGREGRQLLPSNSITGLTVCHTWLKRHQIVCFDLFLLH